MMCMGKGWAHQSVDQGGGHRGERARVCEPHLRIESNQHRRGLEVGKRKGGCWEGLVSRRGGGIARDARGRVHVNCQESSSMMNFELPLKLDQDFLAFVNASHRIHFPS